MILFRSIKCGFVRWGVRLTYVIELVHGSLLWISTLSFWMLLLWRRLTVLPNAPCLPGSVLQVDDRVRHPREGYLRSLPGG